MLYLKAFLGRNLIRLSLSLSTVNEDSLCRLNAGTSDSLQLLKSSTCKLASWPRNAWSPTPPSSPLPLRSRCTTRTLAKASLGTRVKLWSAKAILSKVVLYGLKYGMLSNISDCATHFRCMAPNLRTHLHLRVGHGTLDLWYLLPDGDSQFATWEVATWFRNWLSLCVLLGSSVDTPTQQLQTKHNSKQMTATPGLCMSHSRGVVSVHCTGLHPHLITCLCHRLFASWLSWEVHWSKQVTDLQGSLQSSTYSEKTYPLGITRSVCLPRRHMLQDSSWKLVKLSAAKAIVECPESAALIKQCFVVGLMLLLEKYSAGRRQTGQIDICQGLPLHNGTLTTWKAELIRRCKEKALLLVANTPATDRQLQIK